MVDECWLSGGIAWIVWFIPLQLCVFPGPCNKWSHFEYPYRFLMFFSWLSGGVGRHLPKLTSTCHAETSPFSTRDVGPFFKVESRNNWLVPRSVEKTRLGGGNSKIFYVHPLNWGNFSQFDEHIFQMGLVQPPTSSVKKANSLGWVHPSRLSGITIIAKSCGWHCETSLNLWNLFTGGGFLFYWGWSQAWGTLKPQVDEWCFVLHSRQTSIAGWKMNPHWRCISYSTWGYSSQLC